MLARWTRTSSAAVVFFLACSAAGCTSHHALGAATPSAAAIAFAEDTARNKSVKDRMCAQPNATGFIAVGMMMPGDRAQVPTVRSVNAAGTGHWTVDLTWLPTPTATPFTLPVIQQGARYFVCYPQ
jgi:hypothetical protein